MDTKKLAAGTVAGGIVHYVLSYVIFEMIAGGIYEANYISGDQILREATLEWALVLGGFSLAAVYTMAILKTSSSPSIRDGAVTGAIFGFLVWFGVDFIHYGITDRWNLTLTLVDPLLEFIRCGITGAVIAAVVSRLPQSGSAQATA